MTAENFGRGRPAAAGRILASMRPRPMTAENRVAGLMAAARGRRFNEAAADDRGKHRNRARHVERSQAASMRPRPMTAENASRSSPGARPGRKSLQ